MREPSFQSQKTNARPVHVDASAQANGFENPHAPLWFPTLCQKQSFRQSREVGTSRVTRSEAVYGEGVKCDIFTPRNEYFGQHSEEKSKRIIFERTPQTELQ
tara:strand:+ start:440 stop:745 length:306 start_codon:yes stop_codon:yes gene_type:complete